MKNSRLGAFTLITIKKKSLLIEINANKTIEKLKKQKNKEIDKFDVLMRK